VLALVEQACRAVGGKNQSVFDREVDVVEAYAIARIATGSRALLVARRKLDLAEDAPLQVLARLRASDDQQALGRPLLQTPCVNP